MVIDVLVFLVINKNNFSFSKCYFLLLLYLLFPVRLMVSFPIGFFPFSVIDKNNINVVCKIEYEKCDKLYIYMYIYIGENKKKQFSTTF